MVVTASSVHNLRSKRGLPLVNQIIGWVALGEKFSYFCLRVANSFSSLCLAVSASLFPFVYQTKARDPYSKILSYFLAFSACFVILSISVEGLFFVSYSALLVVWIEVEAAIRHPIDETGQGQRVNGKAATAKASRTIGYQPRTDDLRIALFFLFFVQVAFFGTGNVASISCVDSSRIYQEESVY